MNKIISLIVLVMFFFGGLFLLYDSYSSYDSTCKFVSTAAESQGRVIRLQEEVVADSDGSNSTIYRPVIRFQDQSATDVEFQGHGSNPAAFSVGDSVSIVYQPGEPQNTRINTFSSLWFGSIISGIFGFVFFGLSLWLGYLAIFVGNA